MKNKLDPCSIIVVLLLAAMAVIILVTKPKVQPFPEVADTAADTALYDSAAVYGPSLLVMREQYQHILEPLQLTFEEIESGCNPAAWNQTTDAVGMYQIRKIKVRELNRIQDEVEFSYTDRWDADISAMMFDFDMLLNNEFLFTDDHYAIIERACHLWNGRHVSKEYIQRATNLYIDILNHQ